MLRWNVIAVVYFGGVILIAQALAPAPYDWTQNTVSELAAQEYDNQWLMQLGFVGYGLLLSVGVVAGLRRDRSQWYRELPILIYALAIAAAGVFSAAPFIEGVEYSAREAQLHSLFATMAGISFSLALLLYFFTDEDRGRKIAHLVILILVIATSAAFGLASSNDGVIQRSLYLVSFIWLVFAYDPRGGSGNALEVLSL